VSSGAERRRPVLIVFIALCLGVAVFAITEIAYNIVAERALPGYEAVGAVSLAMDINSYYSFIHQAAEGHFFFRNNMTHEPCDAAFINVQWWAVGKGMAWFDWTPRRAFVVWRFIGSLALMLGFAFLALVTLPRTYQQLVALVMCAFGGGFGWVLALLGSFHLVDTTNTFGLRNPAMDLITAIHPFGQIMKNPHYSLPHGTFLALLAFFIVGERTGRTRWYVASAGVAIIQGLFRPYDTITICAMVPAFIAVEYAITRKFQLRQIVLRALPMLVSVPLLIYYFYIFSLHPVFRFWAEQGKQPPASFFWHTSGLGLAGVFFIYRIARRKRYPFTASWERMLVVLTATILLLYHGNHLTRVLSFSPQIGIPLIPPMIIIALGMLPPLAERWRNSRIPTHVGAVAGFLIVNALSTPLFLTWNANIGSVEARNYIRTTDLDAIAWLAKNTGPDDIVLSSEFMGSRIAYYTPVRVAMGHWALTPNVRQLRKKFERFKEGELPRDKAAEFIEEIRPRYIYVSNPDYAAKPSYFRRTTGAERVFENKDVAIYEVARDTSAG